MNTFTLKLCNVATLGLCVMTLSAAAWSADGEPVCVMQRDISTVIAGGSPQFAGNGCRIEAKARQAPPARNVTNVFGNGTYYPPEAGSQGNTLTARSFPADANVAIIHGNGAYYPGKLEAADSVASNRE